ncbi:hypothetical protein Tco_0003575 [Tanacetum coccineum]
MVNEGIELDASMVPKVSSDDNTSSTEEQDESNSSGYDAYARKERVDKAGSEVEYAAARPSYYKDTLTKVHHSNIDTFENVFAHGIQNHEQLESIPDTYMVKENNSNIVFDIPYRDPDRGKEDHDDVDNEQERALFASLVNNLQCEVETCTKVIREAQQENVVLTKELERYKEKQKHFARYCKKD